MHFNFEFHFTEGTGSTRLASERLEKEIMQATLDAIGSFCYNQDDKLSLVVTDDTNLAMALSLKDIVLCLGEAKSCDCPNVSFVPALQVDRFRDELERRIKKFLAERN